MNYLLSVPVISIIVTILGITVTANAWNFIDGLNGLSSGLGVLSLLSISYLSLKSGNIYMSEMLLCLSATVFGFWVINILYGKIFLGDSGAYLIGTLIGWSGVVVSNNINSVSAWAIFLIIIYPATEAVVSFVRRLYTRKSVVLADNLHLHSLLYKYILYKFSNQSALKINSFCGILLCIYGLLPMIISLTLNGKFPDVFYAVILFVFSYLVIYYILLKKLLLR